ncbi:MAG: BNR repeat-containing protein [Balneolaceae bacterium]|nr:BNR repeat-containing protein [Balneolaceae bacterium]
MSIAKMLKVTGMVMLAMTIGNKAVFAQSNPDDLPPVGPDQTVIADEDIWPHINWASFDQDKVISYGGYQYSIYWNADRVLTLTRRNLNKDEVLTVRLEDYILAEGLSEEQQRNGHRNTVIGISPEDGRLHLAWDHHANDLNYTRSREGLITNPPENISAGDFEPRQPVMEGAPQRVTYPRFLNDHDDNLFFFYRSGGSGSGNIAFFEYNGVESRWMLITDKLFGLEGEYAEWDNSQSRNAYMHDLVFDSNNRLHITWVYRETYATWASNHDLHYAYSDDKGRTWNNNVGDIISDTRKGEVITINSPGIVVWDIPVFSWLMNQGGMTLDSHNNPHVATFHMEKTFEPDDLQHSPPVEVRYRLNYYHYWRDNQGEWHRSEPLPKPVSAGRPMIAVAPDNTVVVYFLSNEGFISHIAREEDQWGKWQSLRLTGPEFTGLDVSKPDKRRLQETNILSFTADHRGNMDGRGYAFLDFDLKRIVDLTRP